VEDALDDSLAESRKRALDLHLSRCDDCREFFAAERDEHRRWFQAMNGHEALRHLPDGFAERFLAEIAGRHAVPQRKWAFVRAIRGIAAVLVAMLLFAGISYAAMVAVEEIRGTEGANQGGTTASPEADWSETEGRVALDAPDSPDAYQLPTANYQLEPNQGETSMTRRRAAVAALAAAMSATPLAAANDDEYQFIISGDPVAAATVGSSSAASDEITLETGALRVAGAADDLEARSRSKWTSVAIALNATKFRTFIMTVR